MATGAAITLAKEDVPCGQPVGGAVTFTNEGAAPVTIKEIKVYLLDENNKLQQIPHSVNVMLPSAGPGAGTEPFPVGTLTANETDGTVVVPFELVVHAPSAKGAAAVDYNVHATVVLEGGAVYVASAATIGVFPAQG